MKKLIITALLLTCFTMSIYSQDTTKIKQKPKATYEVGHAKITVWEDKGKDGTWKNFEVQKIYKKGEKWLTSNSFNENELLELKSAIDKAIAEEN